MHASLIQHDGSPEALVVSRVVAAGQSWAASALQHTCSKRLLVQGASLSALFMNAQFILCESSEGVACCHSRQRATAPTRQKGCMQSRYSSPNDTGSPGTYITSENVSSCKQCSTQQGSGLACFARSAKHMQAQHAPSQPQHDTFALRTSQRSLVERRGVGPRSESSGEQ